MNKDICIGNITSANVLILIILKMFRIDKKVFEPSQQDVAICEKRG